MGAKTLNVIKSYWWVITLVFALGGWMTFVEIGLASNSAKDTQQDQILKEQHEIQKKQQAMMREFKGQMNVILLMLGIKVQDSTVARWKQMPKHMPVGLAGLPISGAEWLCISDGQLLGRTFKWVKKDSVLIRTEWDEREHRSFP